MNRIRLLSEQVANQNRGGEVVETPGQRCQGIGGKFPRRPGRPPDGGNFTPAGAASSAFTDDGVGMSRDDALLSLERQCHGKICGRRI